MQRRVSVKNAVCALWLGFLLVLSACGEPAGDPGPLPELHVLHVAKITEVEGLTMSGSHQVDALTTYRRTDANEQMRVLALIGEHLYDFGIDGSDLHELHLTHICYRALSVTPDGRWATCQYEQGIEIFGLNSQGTEPTYLADDDPDLLLLTPSWAPDGKHLAIATRLRDGGDGAVRIYTASPTYDALHLTARLTFPFESVDGVSWSADGTWLAVEGATSVQSGFACYLVQMRPLAARLYGHEETPVTVTLKPSDVVPLQIGPPFAWFHTAAVSPQAQLTVVKGDRRTIVRSDVLTGQEVPLVVQQAGYICALSWTPDDRHLVFVLCGLFDEVISGPPAQFYVYTSPN